MNSQMNEYYKGLHPIVRRTDEILDDVEYCIVNKFGGSDCSLIFDRGCWKPSLDIMICVDDRDEGYYEGIEDDIEYCLEKQCSQREIDVIFKHGRWLANL